MVKVTSVLAIVLFLGGCAATPMGPRRTLTLHWQRLLDEAGETCERCGQTQAEVQLAAATLKRCLRPLNMDVVLKETAVDAETFAKDTSQSNRIFVDGRPLEDWLGGEVGMSLCGFCCKQLAESVKCRTVRVDGQTYEAIPATLIVRAGLRAAEASLSRAAVTKPCCPTKPSSPARPCCPQ